MIYPAPKPTRTPRKVERAKGQRARRTKGHLFEKLVSMGRRACVRKQACIATGRRTGEIVTAQPWMPATLRALTPYRARVIAAHVDSRGAGNPDEANMVPLEWQVHELVGTKGWAWLVKVCRLMRPEEIAGELETRYLARCAAIAKGLETKGGLAERSGEQEGT